MNRDIGLKLKRLDEALARQANSQLQSVGLTFSQINLLGVLFEQPDHQTTQRQLEVLLGVSHHTIVGLVRRLEAKGFISTYFSADDARMKVASLTSAGERIVNDGADKRDAAEEWLTRGLTDQEVAQLDGLLGKLLDNVSG